MFLAFHECGAAAWLTLLLAVVAVVVSVLAIAMASSNPRGARTASMFALVLVVLVGASGIAGTLLGRAATDRAVRFALSTYRETLRAEGYAEAEQCTRVAGGADVLPMILAISALVIATRGRDQAK